MNAPASSLARCRLPPPKAATFLSLLVTPAGAAYPLAPQTTLNGTLVRRRLAEDSPTPTNTTTTSSSNGVPDSQLFGSLAVTYFLGYTYNMSFREWPLPSSVRHERSWGVNGC